jgi:zinc transport system substrate-binding protein
MLYNHMEPRMSRDLPLAIAVALAFITPARAEVPSVVADIAPVQSLAARVMAGLGTPTLIVPSGASPHGYAMRPSEARALQDAGLVVWIGPDLEPWFGEAIETLAPDAASLALIEVPGTTELPVREDALFEPHEPDEDHQHDEDEDHAHDHAHGAHDPHAWLDPDNARVWLAAIAEALAEADPANAAAYRANAAAGQAEIDALTATIDATLAPVRDRSFIVFHDAYQYFENRFDFPAAGAISLSDAARPSPARIRQIRDRVTGAGVTCVLAEPQFNPDLVATVLDGTEARSATLDPLGAGLPPGPDLYPQLLQTLAQTLADCL